MSSRQLGIAQVIASGICFGFLGVFGKAAYQKGVAPGELLSLRFLIGGTLLGLYVLTRKPKATAHELAVCAGLGVFGYAVFSSFFFEALAGLSASLTVLLLYTFPILVALGGWILFGEKIPRAKLLALPVVMIGVALLIWGDFYILEPQALAFGFASAVFYALYILTSSRLLKGVDSLLSSACIQLAAGLVLGAIHLRDWGRISQVITTAWPILLAIALVCSVAAMSLFLAGLKKLQGWEVSILSTSEPVTSIFLAFALLGERLGAAQIVGALAVLAAFVMIANQSRSRNQQAGRSP